MIDSFRKRPVFKRYIGMAALLIFILSAAFAVNSLIMLGSLNNSLRARIGYLIGNGMRYAEDRVHLYSVSATNVAVDSHVQFLAGLGERTNDSIFFNRAKALLRNLGTLRDTSNEIADVLIFFDNMDIFFTPNGAWNDVFLSLWEANYAYDIDLSWIYSDTRATVFASEGYLVFYNNFQRGVHVFLMVYEDAIESMLAQLIPVDYGTFVAMGMSAYTDGLMITNGGLFAYGEPDVDIHGSGMFAFQFYYNTAAYRHLVRTMTFMAIGIMAVIIAVTIFVLYRIKKGLYDPLGGILQLIDVSGGSPEAQNEFSVIQDTIDLMRTNLAQMNESQRCLDFNQALSAQVAEELHALIELRANNYCALTILFEDAYGHKDSHRIRAFHKDAKGFMHYPVYTISKYSVCFFFLEDSAAYSALIKWADTYVAGDGFCQCGISALYSGLEDIRKAMEESIQCFHEAPAQGLDIQKKAVIAGDGQSARSCRISPDHHIRLIADAASGNMDRVRQNMLDILKENGQANGLAKRQLLLCLYDMICMLADSGTSQPEGAPAERPFFEGIYNPALLFEKLCADLSLRLQKATDDREMLGWVDDNLHKDISLSDLADAMGMSYSYTGFVFKNKAGMTFVEYLQKKRVERSMKLLAENDANTEEIAAAVGFASVNTFFRAFKKYMGVTPGAYRDVARGQAAGKGFTK